MAGEYSACIKNAYIFHQKYLDGKTMCVHMVLSSTNPFHNSHIQEKDNCSGLNAEHTSVHINDLNPRKNTISTTPKLQLMEFICGS
jgi:hypothetical protein